MKFLPFSYLIVVSLCGQDLSRKQTICLLGVGEGPNGGLIMIMVRRGGGQNVGTSSMVTP